jgi:hypothetical protein
MKSSLRSLLAVQKLLNFRQQFLFVHGLIEKKCFHGEKEIAIVIDDQDFFGSSHVLSPFQGNDERPSTPAAFV